MHSILRSKFNKSDIIDEHCEGLVSRVRRAELGKSQAVLEELGQLTAVFSVLPTGTSEHGERGARKFKGIFLARSSFAASVENFEDAMHIRNSKLFLFLIPIQRLIPSVIKKA